MKRRRSNEVQHQVENRRKKDRKKSNATPKKTPNPVQQEKEKDEGKGNNGEIWRVGSSKKKKATPKRKRPPRPDALMIRVGTENKDAPTYADILRDLKSRVELKSIGEKVSRIRRAANGELILELQKTGEGVAKAFQAKISEVLGEKATTKLLTESEAKVFIEIRDIDSVTALEEVHEALVKHFEVAKELPMSAMKSIREAYADTQTAVVHLPSVVADALTKEGKVKIDWVVCRIKEKTVPLICYKCLEFGHRTGKVKIGWVVCRIKEKTIPHRAGNCSSYS